MKKSSNEYVTCGAQTMAHVAIVGELRVEVALVPPTVMLLVVIE
jgi:hypothetical protein